MEEKKMAKSALTLTILSNMTSNYGEGLGNVSSIQKIFKNGNIHGVRSKESLKNAIMVQSGMYEDLEVSVDGAAQKSVGQQKNVSNSRALESGYMNTSVGKDKLTYVRNSSFYVTDAISCDPFVNETRFHNNLFLATTYANANQKNVQRDSKDVGLMPYNYEYDKSLKIYSLTIDLSMIGKDENFNVEAPNEEKAKRVKMLLNAIEKLSLIVKGNMDNAEPILVIGGFSEIKTHQFENLVKVKKGKLEITGDLKDRIAQGYSVALLEGNNIFNELEVKNALKPLPIRKFFENLITEVYKYYGVKL